MKKEGDDMPTGDVKPGELKVDKKSETEYRPLVNTADRRALGARKFPDML